MERMRRYDVNSGCVVSRVDSTSLGCWSDHGVLVEVELAYACTCRKGSSSFAEDIIFLGRAFECSHCCGRLPWRFRSRSWGEVQVG